MAVTKRIFQLSKEFGREEKEIIAYLTEQGIKVSNRLSAVSEDTYNMLKDKFMAPPPPPPEPEPEPEPTPPPPQEVAPAESVEAPPQESEPAPVGKKKKKKNKAQSPQPEQPPQTEEDDEPPVKLVSDFVVANMDKQTQTILFENITAGNDFIRHYNSDHGQAPPPGKKKSKQPTASINLDTWALLFNHKFEDSDSSPAKYWNSVAKFMTRAFKINNAFGMSHRESLAKIRNATNPLGVPYTPNKFFTDEENEKFAAQQKLLFLLFGHGMGMVNDNLFDLKLKAERMKVKYERMSFLEYVTNPQDELRSNDRVPFNELVEAVTYALRGIARRYRFFFNNEARINRIISEFFEWLDGYAKLKEQGAAPAKLEKYLELEEKFVDLAEFMSFDNLIAYKNDKKGKPSPVDILLDLLKAYRDNLDDPDAERNFKYKVRGVTNIIYKPKEFVFIYRFAGLEPHKDYRTPEMIAAAEAEAAAKAAAKAAAAAKAEAEVETETEE